MQPLKSALLLLASAAFLACPSTPVEPEPEPEPEPEAPVRGPCEGEGAALRDGSRVLRWAKPVSEQDVLAPDAEGRLGAVVLYRDGYDRTEVLRARGFKVQRALPLVNGAIVRGTPEELEALRNEPHVAHVEEDHLFRSATLYRSPVPPPTFLGQTVPQPPSEITGDLRRIQAPDIWDPLGSGEVDPDAPAGQGIKVCTLDSGVDRAHAEVQGFYAGGWDFVDNDDDPDDSTPVLSNSPVVTTGSGHGTHVAGTIGARYGHGASVFEWMHEGGVVGVAPRAEMLTGRVLSTSGSGALTGVVAGVDWCVAQGAHIINMSLGSSHPDPAQERAVKAASDAGVLVVAAAGNDELETPGALSYPASFPGAMAVASVNANDRHSAFSQVGDHISVAAPGERVLSATIRGAGYFSRMFSSDLEERPHRVASGSGSGEYEGHVVDCGLADSYESCGQGATCGGFVALVRRGNITFGEKAEFARGQGAKMVLIYDPAAEDDEPGSYTLGDDVSFDIPVFSISRSYGEALLNGAESSVKAGIYLTDYEQATGTSMATPHVAGAAAVVWSAQPDLSAAQVRQLLECSARYVGTGNRPPGTKSRLTGHGIVQIRSALDMLEDWNATSWPAAGTCPTP